MRSSVLFVLAACSSTPVQRPVPTADPRKIEHVESCPGVRATWSGTREDGNDMYSTLTLSDGGKPVTIDLEDVPRANWSFSIFSPDCQRVLLLLSRGGPYHVVRLDHFARYAAGEPPELELHGKPDPTTGTGAGNLRDGTWISNTELSYAWGCCDPPIVERVAIPQR